MLFVPTHIIPARGLRLKTSNLEIVILHTEPHPSGIVQAWATLRPVLLRDYDIPVRSCEVLGPGDVPMIDVNEPIHAEGYYHGVLNALSTATKPRRRSW